MSNIGHDSNTGHGGQQKSKDKKNARNQARDAQSSSLVTEPVAEAPALPPVVPEPAQAPQPAQAQLPAPSNPAGGSPPPGAPSALSVEYGPQVQGKASMVRLKKDGTEVDGWNDAAIGFDIKKIEIALSRAKVDSTYDLTSFVKGIEYQGFDRTFYIKHALTKMSVSVFARFAIIGAIRGSKFEKIKNSCEDMPNDLVTAWTSCGFIAATPKKKTDLTILRNTASIPHWCAYWMWRAEIGKKIASNACPSCLQFPGAASLPMSQPVRLQHLRFCSEFSALLGGAFNMNIYLTACKNQIPIDIVPQELLQFLGVSSATESHVLNEDEIAVYSKAVAKK